MADLTLKRNDTREALRATLEQLDREEWEASGKESFAPIDLTEAEDVRLFLYTTATEEGKERRVKTGTVDVVEAAEGKVEYQWEADDLAKAGSYSMEFEITWSDGTVQTVPNEGYYSLVIEEDLGPTGGEE